MLAQRSLLRLTQAGHRVDLVMTRAALFTAALELGKEQATVEGFLAHLPDASRDLITVYRNSDFSAPMASGSVLYDGMLLVPCSMASIAAIAMGLSDNLLRRSADVCLKERRRLVIIPREAPLSQIHLENMARISQMGGVILPPMPAWHMQPKSLAEVEDQIVGRAFDLLGLDAPFYERWESRVAPPTEIAKMITPNE